MSYFDIKLETKDGTTICYFAPSFEWETNYTNDAATNALPGGDTGTQVFDLSQWLGEITIQGQFNHSENLPPAHRDALATSEMFGSLPVTAGEQVDRALRYLVYNPNPPYNLYVNDRQYTGNSQSGITPSQGIYPNVSCTEIRTPEEAGLTRDEYLFRFNIGFVTSSEGDE